MCCFTSWAMANSAWCRSDLGWIIPQTDHTRVCLQAHQDQPFEEVSVRLYPSPIAVSTPAQMNRTTWETVRCNGSKQLWCEKCPVSCHSSLVRITNVQQTVQWQQPLLNLVIYCPLCPWRHHDSLAMTNKLYSFLWWKIMPRVPLWCVSLFILIKHRRGSTLSCVKYPLTHDCDQENTIHAT